MLGVVSRSFFDFDSDFFELETFHCIGPWEEKSK
jgi:hypothetical protein